MIAPSRSATRLPWLLLPLFLAGCQSTLDETIPDRDARVRKYIDGRIETRDAPGIQYVVVSADTEIFEYAAGLADIGAHRPVLPGTTMMVYSMTKPVTAAAVLQLVERGLIGLDDPVASYLPDVPYGNRITIRQLISHTSGIPNPIPLKWVHLAEEHASFNEHAVRREVLAENPEVDFEPGEKYSYSNISYWLLGAVIEKISGESYREYVRKNICDRLALTETDIDVVIPSPANHSRGYLPKWSWMNLLKSFFMDSKFMGEYEDGWLNIRDHYLNGPSFGGIVGSATVMSVFLRDQLCDESVLFGGETKRLFFEQQKDIHGEPVPMTLGWHVGTVNNERYYFKEGGGGGFHCEMRIYPGRKIATVVIGNNTLFDATEFLNVVDRDFLR